MQFYSLYEIRAFLNRLRQRFHRRSETRYDPVQFLYRYLDPRDREIVGLVASALAFGSVEQILRAIRLVLEQMESCPALFCQQPFSNIVQAFKGFRYRFVTGADLGQFLYSAGIVQRECGSVCECFLRHLRKDDATVDAALQGFLKEFRLLGGIQHNYLIPMPYTGGACKRMNLFLRWMVRKDAVDPGGWWGIKRAQLIVPLDVHMYRLGQALGMTSRKTADMKMAKEITAFLRRICPEDPVRYDFALMRYGVRMNRTQ